MGGYRFAVGSSTTPHYIQLSTFHSPHLPTHINLIANPVINSQIPHHGRELAGTERLRDEYKVDVTNQFQHPQKISDKIFYILPNRFSILRNFFEWNFNTNGWGSNVNKRDENNIEISLKEQNGDWDKHITFI